MTIEGKSIQERLTRLRIRRALQRQEQKRIRDTRKPYESRVTEWYMIPTGDVDRIVSELLHLRPVVIARSRFDRFPQTVHTISELSDEQK